MVQATLVDILDWINNHLWVILVGSPKIPSIPFKVLPKYEGTRKISYEQYQDVSHLASSFNITNETAMTQLFSHSFAGKVAK